MTTRGHCPDSLALEVHALALAGTHRRLYVHRLRPVIEDAVNEAFAEWLGQPSDKTEHDAGQHAHWLTKRAVDGLIGKNARPSRRAVRPIAAWAGEDPLREEAAFEAVLREHHGAAAPDQFEGRVLRELEGSRVVAAGGWQGALRVLRERGWLLTSIARACGAHYDTARTWAQGRNEPRPEWQRVMLDLVREGIEPPPKPRKPKAERKQEQAAPLEVVTFEEVRQLLLALVRRGWGRPSLAARIKASATCVGAWLAGRSIPRGARLAGLRGLLASGERPVMPRHQGVIDLLVARQAADLVRLGGGR